jgi:hypothetical protein
MILKLTPSLRLLSTALLVLLLGTTLANAQTTVMTIVKDAANVNHYPGMDGLIGNGDDVVSGSLTTIQSSAPNANGSYSHNSFLFAPFGPQDPNLPPGFDAITFVEGSVAVDVGVMTSGGGPIVSALNITSGTEPFPGHGAYTSTITAVNSGTYNPATGEFMLNVDISYVIFGNLSTEPGVTLTGTAIYQDSADFGTPTGNTYFDSVVVPLAQAAGANSAVFISGTGTLTSLGFPINATVVAFDQGAFQINAGLNDAWVTDVAPFQGLFFTVFEDIGAFFLSWFTFDSVPPQGATAVFGAADQRWVTGLGIYSGNSVTVSVELTSGGIFNGSVPEAVQTPGYGTITIVFNNCNEAIMTYNFPSEGLSGQVTLTRVLDDNVALCQAMSDP